MHHRSDIIVIGAGACGLMAAKELSDKGKSVTILEAKSNAGGRIRTLQPEAFLQPVEAGAEFIHGKLPVTLQLLKGANITYTKAEGDMLRNSGGKWHEDDKPVEGWDELTEKMDELKEDTTLTLFLETYFGGENHKDLRQQALQYAQGFDAVDPNNASVIALRDEWEHDEEVTYRVDGGYGRMIQYLQVYCEQKGCSFVFNSAVTNIEWKEGEVKITTQANEIYEAEQAIIAIPVGILQSGEDKQGQLRFLPALPDVQDAVKDIGYGNVIKIVLQFSSLFWQQKNALFFFSDQKIATWWTQSPSQYPMLTGWIAGKKTDEFKDVSEDDLLQLSLQSLATIFNKSEAEMKGLLTASHIINWENDAFAKGAYSYSMIGSEEAKRTLNEPIANTLFFAGEALYSGKSGGTVEAALVQGLEVVKKILKSKQIAT